MALTLVDSSDFAVPRSRPTELTVAGSASNPPAPTVTR